MSELPVHYWVQRIADSRIHLQPMQNAAVRMAIEAGLLEAIGASKGRSVTAEDLSKTTGFNALLIGTALPNRALTRALTQRKCTVRIMRLVTYVGYCDEVGESEYAANKVTYLVNTPAMTGAERHQFVYTYSMSCSFAETLVQL